MMEITKAEIVTIVFILLGGFLCLYYGIEPVGCAFVNESKGSIAYLMGCGR